MRYRWAILAVGTAGQAAFSAVLLGLPVLAPELRAEFDLSLTEVGVVLASVWIGPVFTLLAWGLLADRVGERRVLSTGVAGMGVLVAAAAEAPGFSTLVLLLGAASAAGASVNAASGRAVMHWFGAEERGLALGLRQAALPLGGATAALILPPIEAAGGIEAAFLALGGICIAAAAAAAVVLRDRPRDAKLEEAVPWTLRDHRLWLLSAASGFYLIAQVALTGFVVLFLHDARNLSTATAAAILALAQVLAVGLRVAAGRWSDRVHARIRPLRIVGLAISLTVVVSAVLLSVPLAVLLPALVAATALSMTWNGLSFTATAELAGSARSGAALGFQQTTLSIVGVVAAPVFATLVDATSWRVAFALVALGPLAGWALLGRLPELAPENRRDSGEGEPRLVERGLAGRQPLKR